MNWLAHVFLSEPEIEFRLGNLLADLVKGHDRVGVSDAFLRGVRQHQEIDVFTDSHPVVHQSRARISSEYRHVTGILVDVFYDHFLALHWDQYSTLPLAAFAAGLYADIRAHSINLPAEAQATVDRMICEDRLASYRRIEGIEATLRRVSIRLSKRVGKDFQLQRAVSDLQLNFDGLESDFGEFFPLLQSRVEKGTKAK